MPTVTESPVPPGMHFEELEEPAECAAEDEPAGRRVAEIRGGSHCKQRWRGPRITDEKVEAAKRMIASTT